MEEKVTSFELDNETQAVHDKSTCIKANPLENEI